MVKISAFQALRPNKKLVAKVPTKAYSNYSKEDIKKEIYQNPYSFLNIITTNPNISTEKRFKTIRSNFIEFEKKGILIKDKNHGVYVYRQTKNQHTYTGLICAIELKEYQNKKIKIHEKTIKKREELFSKYLSITKIHAEPILITYDSTKTLIDQNDMSDENKLYDFQNKDGLKHEIWKITNQQKINKIIKNFQSISHLYIADGHHRMASSLRYGKTEKCLAYILPKQELTTYPFHRVLSTKKSVKNILQEFRNHFNIKKINLPCQYAKNIQFYINKQWYEIILEKDQKKNILNDLLVSKLLHKVLKPIFEIDDERGNKHISYKSGNTPIKKITENIKNNEILFFMNTIEIDTIIQIANKNKTTPPKSTFISPKIPSGLIMMELI
ncbi:MAG: hypothetical protein CMP56_03400 [Flavobacteriales bacterium]|nr:hypothetical protein [Flavobacteriales bacterium]